MEGTVTDWEAWTGQRFPESGPYPVDRALVPVEIDLASGRGVEVVLPFDDGPRRLELRSEPFGAEVYVAGERSGTYTVDAGPLPRWGAPTSR